jgi:hypothetical protein
MKNLIARIKGYDYKGFFLKHGEKVGMGIVGAIVVAALAITSWSGYAKVPEQFVEQAAKADSALLVNNFPATKKADFPQLSADQQIAKLIGPVELKRFEHDEPFSPKLFAYRLPAEEPEVLPPVELIARAVVFAMEEMIPESETPDESAQPEPRHVAERPGARPSGARRGKERQDLDELAALAAATGLLPGEVDVGALSGDMWGGFAMGSGKSRTMPAAMIVGRVDRRKQLEKLQQKLHLDSVYEAANYLEYVEFKIQRQRAVRGPNPWPQDEASWKDLNIENSVDVIEAAFDYDPEVVPAENTDVYLTSPLPRRLDGQWTWENAGHRNLPKLDETGQMLDQAFNYTAVALAEDEEEVEEAPKRGFARLQRDVNALRSQALGAAGGGTDFQDMLMGFLGGTTETGNRGRRGGRKLPQGLEQMLKAGGAGGLSNLLGMGMLGMSPGSAATSRGGAAGGAAQLQSLLGAVGGAGVLDSIMASGGGGRPGRGAGPGIPADLAGLASAFGVSGLSSLVGAAGPGGQLPTSYLAVLGGGAMGPMSLGADAILFRYFDFDVEPGECYRYRVKLVIYNPSFEEEFVASPEVAQGENRVSQNWSTPSTPAAVPRDVEYALARISRGVTSLEVIQHDPETGMLISGTLEMKQGPGQYVGGPHRVKRMKPVEGTNELEEVFFSSRDVFLDSAAPAAFLPAVQEDLKLSDKELRALQHSQALAQAVTVSRFGEMLTVDADSKKHIEPAMARYKQQEREFEEQEKENPLAAANVNDVFNQLLGIDDKASKKKGPVNPLRNPGGMRNMMRAFMGGAMETPTPTGRGNRGPRGNR